MSPATVDASVWVAAADRSDVFCVPSRAFLAGAVQRRAQIFIPAFAVTEVSCALARKLRDTLLARRLTSSMLMPSRVAHIPLDERLLALSVRLGTSAFLRGADALYAATARTTGSTLVSWDTELIQWAQALTPTDWLTANP